MARTKGALNKNKQALLLRLQERYPDYQPVLEMAGAALEISRLAKQAKTDPDLWFQAAQAHDKVAAYVTPKLKALELSSDPDDPLEVNIIRHKQIAVVGVCPGCGKKHGDEPDSGADSGD